MEKKYQDLINYDDIKESVDFWNSPMVKDTHSHTFKGMTVEQAIEYWKSRAIKTDKIETSLKVYLKNQDLLYGDFEVNIITELLNHPEKDRFRLIYDGSYYSHRIWFHVSTNRKISISPQISWVENHDLIHMANKMNEMMFVKDKIQFLLDNFEVVYIQMPIVEDRHDIIEELHDGFSYRYIYN